MKVYGAVGKKASTYLNQIGTVTDRGANIYVKFSEGREFSYPITCVEAV